MNWPTKLIFVRHGESEGNTLTPEENARNEKPNHDFALSQRGREQAMITGEHLRTALPQIDTFFCSTYRRTQETLSLLYPNAKPIIDSRLNEYFHGIWNTVPHNRIAELYPEEASIREREGLYYYRPPGGQNGQDVDLMIQSFIQTLKIDHDGQTILIAAHGNWLLLFWRIMFNLTPNDFIARRANNSYKNCAVAIYERKDSAMHLVTDNVVYY